MNMKLFSDGRMGQSEAIANQVFADATLNRRRALSH